MSLQCLLQWCLALGTTAASTFMTLLGYYGIVGGVHAPRDSWCVIDREVCRVHNPAQRQVWQPVCTQQVPQKESPGGA